VFIVGGKKVRYSDAKIKELYVFRPLHCFHDSGEIDLLDDEACGSSAGADPQASDIS
jgi:hypothetical protein